MKLLLVLTLFGVMAALLIVLEYLRRRSGREAAISLRVPLVITTFGCDCRVNVIVVSDESPILRGHGFIRILPEWTVYNNELLQKLWKVMCDKLANQTFTGTTVGPGRYLELRPKGGTKIVDVVNFLKSSGFDVRSCVM